MSNIMLTLRTLQHHCMVDEWMVKESSSVEATFHIGVLIQVLFTIGARKILGGRCSSFFHGASCFQLMLRSSAVIEGSVLHL